ncbi:MAG: aminopeptidase P family protein [Alphaproteobacteria bacterium]
MRQSFVEKADPSNGAPRVAALRAYLDSQGVDGYLIPRADEYQGEYVPPHAERLAWISGFTGSAGLAIVLKEKAAVFVDGRYTVQVREQVDADLFEIVSTVTTQPEDWIADTLAAGTRLAFDPWLLTPNQVDNYTKACDKAGAALVPLDGNAIDAIWTDQPERPTARTTPHALERAGKDSAAKRHEIGTALAKGGADAVVLTLPDSIAWLLNIRGGDVAHNPVALAHVILRADGHADLFIDERKVDDGLRTALGNGVTVRAESDLGPALDALGQEGARVRLDPAWAPAWVATRLTRAGAKLTKGADPCMLPKACKTSAEIAGARAAHQRDGVAVTRFLAWLAAEAPQGGLDEISAVRRLEAIREETGALKDISFETISGSGPHAAMPHYRVTERTNRPLEPGTLYLVDSGGQYTDGTTDITRTIAVGTPTDEMRDRFTRVLKGMIAVTLARFPEGTRGVQLDTLARQALWDVGLDYDHGTGHGVGAYLSVHEGPQSLSKVLKDVPLKPGMILSNEPGYYKQGAFGIRIENLIVVEAPSVPAGGERPMHSFETLTLAPIDRTLIDVALLTERERDWLNAYHIRVREALSPALDDATRSWLEEVTQPV